MVCAARVKQAFSLRCNRLVGSEVSLPAGSIPHTHRKAIPGRQPGMNRGLPFAFHYDPPKLMNDWETIANRLRSRGLNFSWFPFVDRDGQTQWRVYACNSDGTQLTVQGESLLVAVSGLERASAKR
jgi:hypothetical protein